MRTNQHNKFPTRGIYQSRACLWQVGVMVLIAGAVCLQAADTRCVSLAGAWRFQLDTADAGISGR